MTPDLKDMLRQWLDGDTPLNRDGVEILRAAGLIAPAGFQITEMGRNLILQKKVATKDDPQLEPMHVEAYTNAFTHEEVRSAKDTQIGGDHYKKLGQYQPWEVLSVWLTPEELRGYMKGTVIAYLAREQDKGKDQDVAKALHTMQLWQDVRKDK